MKNILQKNATQKENKPKHDNGERRIAKEAYTKSQNQIDIVR